MTSVVIWRYRACEAVEFWETAFLSPYWENHAAVPLLSLGQYFDFLL